MDIIGKWKVKELGLMQLGDMSMKMFTPAEIENLEDNEDYLQFVSSIYDFSNTASWIFFLRFLKSY